jgi:hypothetical protein
MGHLGGHVSRVSRCGQVRVGRCGHLGGHVSRVSGCGQVRVGRCGHLGGHVSRVSRCGQVRGGVAQRVEERGKGVEESGRELKRVEES